MRLSTSSADADWTRESFQKQSKHLFRLKRIAWCTRTFYYAFQAVIEMYEQNAFKSLLQAVGGFNGTQKALENGIIC